MNVLEIQRFLIHMLTWHFLAGVACRSLHSEQPAQSGVALNLAAATRSRAVDGAVRWSRLIPSLAERCPSIVNLLDGSRRKQPSTAARAVCPSVRSFYSECTAMTLPAGTDRPQMMTVYHGLMKGTPTEGTTMETMMIHRNINDRPTYRLRWNTNSH